MPELPEVQTVVNTLIPHALGARIIRTEIIRPQFIHAPGKKLETLLTGRRIDQIARRGKRILITLDPQARLLIHLGMTGRILILQPGESRRPHTHLVLHLQKRSRLVEVQCVDPRRFGEVRWLGDARGDEGLGIEALDLRPAHLRALLAQSRRPIKNLLLDQSRIAGLGNIYADESLFAARIHPLTPACRIPLEAADRLCRAIRHTLLKALRHHGSTLRDYVDATGTAGRYQKLHKVYGRENEPCRRCRNAIQRIVLAGRSSWYCPRCQILHTK